MSLPEGADILVSDRFCATGALYRVFAEMQPNVPNDAKYAYADAVATLLSKARDMGYLGIIPLNDVSDHETVMKMFDLAIEGLNGRDRDLDASKTSYQ